MLYMETLLDEQINAVNPFEPRNETLAIPLSRRQTKSEFYHKLHKEIQLKHIEFCATCDKNDGVLSA